MRTTVMSVLVMASIFIGSTADAVSKTKPAGRKKPAGEMLIDKTIDTTKGVTKQANITRTFTAAVVEQYRKELEDLTNLRSKAKVRIDREPDPLKKQAEAAKFYELQKEYLDRMAADIDFTNQKLDALYNNIRTAMGGYGTTEAGLDREAAAHAAKKQALSEQNNLKNEATLLLAEKKQLPGYPDQIDEASDEWFEFAEKEDALFEKYEDAEDEVRRCDRKATFYGQVKGALSAHKDKAVKWSGYCRKVRRKYRSLGKDLAVEQEKVNEMIALGKMNENLIEMAGLGEIAGQVDGLVVTLAEMGFLTDIVIPDPPDGVTRRAVGAGTEESEELSLEKIAGQQ